MHGRILAAIVTLCVALAAAGAAAAPAPVENADLLGLRPGMSLAEVEAMLARRTDVHGVDPLTLLTPQARRDKGGETYVRRLVAYLSERRVLIVTFVSPLSGARLVEVSLSQGPTGKPAAKWLEDATARFGPPTSRMFRDGERNLIAAWNGRIEQEDALITPLPGATVTFELKVVHDRGVTWTLFAPALSQEDKAKLRSFR